jgi:hypothetical protein
MIDILDLGEENAEVRRARNEMVAHPMVVELIASASSWPGYALKRHNDAKHPLHQLSVLADFGLDRHDPGMDELIGKLLSRQDQNGAFQTLSFVYKRFAGVEGEHWTWMMCDAPTILYALLSFGLEAVPAVQSASDQLRTIVRENGWPCAAGDPLPASFKGPGKREDPCPYANLITLKALANDPDASNQEVAPLGLEVLLEHWDHAYQRKLFMFGAGTNFRKLKYPFVWYDILHMAEVLSHYPAVYEDERFISLLEAVSEQADGQGRYTATSMYRAWQEWSFANKKKPSPWLTFLAVRIKKRAKIPIN